MRWMRVLALLAALAAPVRAAAIAMRCERVVDGDTMVLRQGGDRVMVRLAHIDAPEADQPGGRDATAALRRLAQGQVVELTLVDRDRYGRLVAVVSVDGRDLSVAMLELGHAWQFHAHDDDPGRAELEHAARTAGRGIWAMPAVAPWIWRTAVRMRMPPAPVVGSCGRRSCRQMSSCGQARDYLVACSATWLDRDGDGTPCEALCR